MNNNNKEKAFDIVSAEAVSFYNKWFDEFYEEVSKHESVKVYVNKGAYLDTEIEFTAFNEEDNPNFFESREQEKTILVKISKLMMNSAEATFFGNDFFYMDDNLSFRKCLRMYENFTETLYNIISWSDLLSKNKSVVKLLEKFLENYQIIATAKEKIRKIEHDAELDAWRLKHGYEPSI